MIFLLVALAALLRTLMSYFTIVIARDTVNFIDVASALAVGDIFALIAEEQHPFYPLLIAVVHSFSASWVISAKVVAVVMGILTVFPLYFLARHLFDAKTAYISVFLYAISPYLVRYSADGLSESTYGCMLMLTLLSGYILISRHRNIFSGILTGFLSGLTYLTRPEGVLVGCVVIAGVVVYDLASRKKRFLRLVICVAMIVVGFMIVALPYMYCIKHVTGKWRFTAKKPVTMLIPFLNDSDVERSSPDISGHLDIVSDAVNMASVMRFEGLGSVANALIQTFHPLLFLFFIAGCVFLRRTTVQWNRTAGYLLIGWSAVMLYILYRLAGSYYISKRHLYPFVVVLLPFAALGMRHVVSLVMKYGMIKRERIAVTFILLIVSVVILPKTLKPQRTDKWYLLDIKHELAGYITGNPFIAVDDERIGFYAGLQYTVIEKEHIPPETFLSELNVKNIQYLLVSEDFIEKFLTEAINFSLLSNRIVHLASFEFPDTTYYLYEISKVSTDDYSGH